jgi:hypothetical protein
MSLIGDYASRFSTHLVCGDDGWDVGDHAAHQYASEFRASAGFVRNPSKEVVSDRCGLLKEIAFNRVDGRWVIDRTPLKIRVISGDGDCQDEEPRILTAFEGLDGQQEVTSDGPIEIGHHFLRLRYLRPLRRLQEWGIVTPIGPPLHSQRYSQLLALNPDPRKVLRRSKGGPGTTRAYLDRARRKAETRPWGWQNSGYFSDDRQEVEGQLAYDVATQPLPRGMSSGAWSIPDMLHHLNLLLLKAKKQSGPRIVSMFGEGRLLPSGAGDRKRDPYGRTLL